MYKLKKIIGKPNIRFWPWLKACSLKSTYFCLLVAVFLFMATMTHVDAREKVITNIDRQLEQTVAKLIKIPVNTYAADLRLGKVMVETARMFLGTPYVSGTLEKD